MQRIAHFELHADDPERAIKFYQDVFGWEIEQSSSPEEYWLVTTGDGDVKGINGGLMRRTDPAARATFSINVASVDEYVDKVVANGGSIVAARTTIPGFGYLAYVKDTEDVVFGIFQPDVTAK